MSSHSKSVGDKKKNFIYFQEGLVQTFFFDFFFGLKRKRIVNGARVAKANAIFIRIEFSIYKSIIPYCSSK
tara:strand:- start:213 stop:425 length:213 start_codon:yes stop_codon:yes gene_type:complete